jgi:class 3 adenylate cyclase
LTRELSAMGLSDELKNDVNTFFATNWQGRDGQKVPEPEDVRLGNDAVNLEATVLYADLAESTDLVDRESKTFAAEIYKSYLHCASRIIKAEGGVITAFDGDRVMGVFIGDSKNTTAARCALKINHSIANIINPAIKNQYPSQTYTVRHAVGIDTSALFVARTGVRGSNDLVWVGRAANYAAKLCSLRTSGYSAFVTHDVFGNMHNDAKYGGNPIQMMWTQLTWNEKNVYVYGSSWCWTP